MACTGAADLSDITIDNLRVPTAVDPSGNPIVRLLPPPDAKVLAPCPSPSAAAMTACSRATAPALHRAQQYTRCSAGRHRPISRRSSVTQRDRGTVVDTATARVRQRGLAQAGDPRTGLPVRGTCLFITGQGTEQGPARATRARRGALPATPAIHQSSRTNLPLARICGALSYISVCTVDGSRELMCETVHTLAIDAALLDLSWRTAMATGTSKDPLDAV